MLRSMTGFASREFQLVVSDVSKSMVTINVKSLNARYFETNYRIPPVLMSLETDITKIFKKKLVRGTIHCSINMSNPALFKSSVELSLPLVASYVDAVRIIKEQHAVEGNLTISTLLSLPNLFVVGQENIDETSKAIILRELDLLVDDLIDVQTKEGALLSQDLQQRIMVMNKELAAIEIASNKTVEEQKKKITEMLASLDLDETKFSDIKKSSVYTILEKIDIHEEIVRFKSHIISLQSQLVSDGAEKGKRLDFTLQELGREINTIAAKCSDALVSSMAINVKVELEKAREQVQNIV